MTRKLIEMGMSLDQIVKASGLSYEEIEKLGGVLAGTDRKRGLPPYDETIVGRQPPLRHK